MTSKKTPPKRKAQRPAASRAAASGGRKRKPRAAEGLGEAAVASPAVTGHYDLARSRWEHAEWRDLAQLRIEDIETDPDRAKTAMLVASAHMQLGDATLTRRYADAAIAWGCDKAFLARVLISGAHNTLGRAASALADREVADRHFQQSIRLVEPLADTELLARARRMRELTHMGLLMDAVNLIHNDLKAAANAPTDATNRIKIIETELNVLRHELSLLLKRGQLYPSVTPEVRADSSAPVGLDARSVSQLGQDLWVLERTAYKKGGYFVEFGATDGVLMSNTLLLEAEFGWTGLCAEPNPELYAQLRKNRHCVVSDACIGGRTGENLEFILADALGGITDFASLDKHGASRNAYRADGRVMQVTTISLEDFLIRNNAPREIDYLSIDTEGSEYEILSNFPFGEWKIRLLTVEHNFTPQREQIRELLEGYGYRRTEAQWDDWYELAN